jgi:SAM-dependent methyltransferase
MDYIEQQLLKTRNFFNARADDERWLELPERERGLVRAGIGAARVKPGDLVLEPGCGAGRVTRELEEAVGAAGWVFALDISDRMLARARSAGRERVGYSLAPVERLPLRADSMDAVLCYNCFHLFACPLRALTEIQRVLKPGGRLAIVHSEPMEKLYRPVRSGGGSGLVWSTAPAELGLLLVRRGFELEQAPRLNASVLLAARKSGLEVRSGRMESGLA